MVNHVCEACIDFRFQPSIDQWIKDNFQPRTYDRVAYAGGVKDIDTILTQVNTSHRLHHINRVVLINHEDCGAYGGQGTSEKHAEDLKVATDKIKSEFPDLETETYYLHLDGTFEAVK